jgi:YD repeat-containing protein
VTPPQSSPPRRWFPSHARQHPRRVTPAAPDLQQLCGRQHYGSAKVPFRIDDSNCLVINRLLRVARLLLLGGYDGVGTFTTAYDANGRPVSVAAPGGVSVSSSYDGMGRLIGQAGSGAEAVTAARSFGYDLAGNMTSASAPGGTDTFGFNDRGLLLSASGPSGSSSFSYNGDGQVSSASDAAGTTSYTYDGGRRLATLADPLTGTTAAYSYTQQSQVSQISYGAGGDTRTFGCNGLHRGRRWLRRARRAAGRAAWRSPTRSRMSPARSARIGQRCRGRRSWHQTACGRYAATSGHQREAIEATDASPSSGAVRQGALPCAIAAGLAWYCCRGGAGGVGVQMERMAPPSMGIIAPVM